MVLCPFHVTLPLTFLNLEFFSVEKTRMTSPTCAWQRVGIHGAMLQGLPHLPFFLYPLFVMRGWGREAAEAESRAPQMAWGCSLLPGAQEACLGHPRLGSMSLGKSLLQLHMSGPVTLLSSCLS